MGVPIYEITKRFDYGGKDEVTCSQPMDSEGRQIRCSDPRTKDGIDVDGGHAAPLGLYCPGGNTDLVPDFIEPDGKTLWMRCQCSMTWWFRFPIQILDKAKPDKHVSRGEIPTCPCHGQALEISYAELEDGKGIGKCAYTGEKFVYEEEEASKELTKGGTPDKSFSVTGEEHEK